MLILKAADFLFYGHRLMQQVIMADNYYGMLLLLLLSRVSRV